MPMPRALSPDKELKICERYQAGEKCYQLAPEYNVSQTTICNILRRFNVSRRNTGYPAKLSPSQDEWICHRYLNGEGSHRLAIVFKVTPATIWRALKRKGINAAPHKAPVKLKKRQIDDLCEQYQAGQSMEKLADAFNIGKTTVSRHLRKCKVPRRFSPAEGPFGGVNHPGWKGGRTRDPHGYILIKCPVHPHTNNNKYVLEHRLIMEAFLSRYLRVGEVVHHENGIPDDNRLENLKLFKNQTEHIKYHHAQGVYSRKTPPPPPAKI